MSYATKYRVRAGSQDGRTYRVDFARWGASGGITTLSTSPDGITLEVGTPGAQSVWPTILPQRLTVQVQVDGALLDFSAISTDEWQVTLWLEGSPDVLLWWGYLDPGIIRQPLYRTGFAEISASGFGSPASDVRYATNLTTRDDLARIISKSIASSARATIANTTIAMLTRYYPYLAGATLTGEPLERLQVAQTLFHGDTYRDAIAQVAASFGAEVFTSASSVWVVQRGALHDLVAAVSSATAVPVRTLSFTGSYGSPAISAGDMTRDLDSEALAYEYDIAPALPEGIHVAEFRFAPPAGAVLTNTRFQDPAVGDANDSENPRYWSVAEQPDGGRQGYTWSVAAAGGYRRARRVFLDSTVISGESAPNTYALQVVSEGVGFEGLAARQKTGFRIPGGADNDLKVTLEGRRVPLPNDAFDDAHCYVYVQDGSDVWYLVRNEITVGSQLLVGDAISMSVVSGDGASMWGASPVNGTVLIRKGTVLHDGNDSVTLTEDYRVGDAVLVGRHQKTGTGGFSGGFYYWHWRKDATPHRPSVLFPTTGTVGASFRPQTEIFTVLQDPQGRPVSGVAYIDIWQHPVTSPDTPGAGVYTVYRQTSLTLTKGNAEARGIEVLSETGTRGIRERLPIATMGDGPNYESISALWDKTTGQATLQQGTLVSPQAAGWKIGPYTNTAEASTGRTLEETRAFDAGQQMGSPTDLVYLTVYLHGGRPIILPHHVIIAEGVPRWRTYYRWRVVAGAVEIHAVALNRESHSITASRSLT